MLKTARCMEITGGVYIDGETSKVIHLPEGIFFPYAGIRSLKNNPDFQKAIEQIKLFYTNPRYYMHLRLGGNWYTTPDNFLLTEEEYTSLNDEKFQKIKERASKSV